MMNWQVYVKQEGRWTARGEPTSKAQAEHDVAELWVPIHAEQKKKIKRTRLSYAEPHCVPI